MNILQIILILIAGTAGGFINTLAGGGSLLTLPVLIFSGLPSAVANGTNRIALMIQNIIAVSNFKSKGYFNPRLSLMLAIPAVIGSIIGARMAIILPDLVFNRILALVMIIMLGLILWNPTGKLAQARENLSQKRQITAIITFFFIGIYGGFIQAGVGFIIITALTLLTGLSLVKINSIKVFVILIYIFSSLFVFIYSGNVNWLLGLILAVGNGFGAWLGSTVAVKKGDKWVKIVLVIAVVLMAGNLIYNN
jgi:uncharacterized protein